LHEYLMAIFGSLVTLYAAVPPLSSSSTSLDGVHKSTMMTATTATTANSSRRSVSANQMMITHVGSSGNTWYTSNQLEMITYIFFVMVSLASNDMNILQLCQKSSFVIQLIQWLDITTPLTTPIMAVTSAISVHTTTHTTTHHTTTTNTTGGTNLTMLQLCAIYIKLHYLGLKFIVNMDYYVPELIESSDYKAYILTIVKKTKKSIIQMLKYYSTHNNLMAASGGGSGGGSGGNGNASNAGGNNNNNNNNNNSSGNNTYKGLVHQRYLYLLDQINLSEIEDFVNDERIAMLKDSCIIS